MAMIRLWGAALVISVLFAPGPAMAGSREKAEELVREAVIAVAAFAEGDIHTDLASNAARAKAVVIIPASVRAGFVFGASGGNAALLARDDRGRWSQPAFLRVGSVSFGFQAGGDVSQIILLVMTRRGKEQLLSTNVKLGADLSVAAGATGVGGKVQSADIIAYSQSKGLYGSVSVEGAVLKIHHKWNRAYYGRAVTPLDIIALGKVSNPKSAPLVRAVTRLAAGG